MSMFFVYFIYDAAFYYIAFKQNEQLFVWNEFRRQARNCAISRTTAYKYIGLLEV